MKSAMIIVGLAWIILVALSVTAGVTVADRKRATAATLGDCSRHCSREHEGELKEQKLCVELCRLFGIPEPAMEE